MTQAASHSYLNDENTSMIHEVRALLLGTIKFNYYLIKFGYLVEFPNFLYQINYILYFKYILIISSA